MVKNAIILSLKKVAKKVIGNAEGIDFLWKFECVDTKEVLENRFRGETFDLL